MYDIIICFFAMEYNLNIVQGNIECLQLAIATESNYGTRTFHVAQPVAAGKIEEATAFKVRTTNADAIHGADKITLCALLPSGGVVAQAYLLKSHMVDNCIKRDVQLYTCNYDKRIMEVVQECIEGEFDNSISRAAKNLLLVSVQKRCMDNGKSYTRKEVESELTAYNKIAEKETCLMKQLDSDVKKEVDARLSNPDMPSVEVVLLRGPQLLKFPTGKAKTDEESKCDIIHIKPSHVPSVECMVPRTAYLSVAIENILLTHGHLCAAEIETTGTDGRNAHSSLATEQHTTLYADKLKNLMCKGKDTLHLVSMATLDLEGALGCTRDNYNTQATLRKWSSVCKGSKPENDSSAGKGFFSFITSITGNDAANEAPTLFDHLWNDLIFKNSDSSGISTETKEFYTMFMPLTHGDYGPTSENDPYRLDQAYIPTNTETTGGQVVSSEAYYNRDCEVLSARCLSHWRAQREAVEAYLKNPDLLEPLLEDSNSFMAFLLATTTLAHFPVNGLVQCSTHMGEHVTHARCVPQETWNVCNGKMQDIYKDAINLREDCKTLLKGAFDALNESNIKSGKGKGVKVDIDALLKKVAALYGNANLRVQDCTVSSKTPNGFNFYNTLIAFYPYVQASHSVRQLFPNMKEFGSSKKSFEKTINAAIAEPEKLFIMGDPIEAQKHIGDFINVFTKRLELARA